MYSPRKLPQVFITVLRKEFHLNQEGANNLYWKTPHQWSQYIGVENFAPFTRVFRSTKTTLRQSVESIVFNHLAHLYSLVTAVVQELLSKTWKRTLDFILVYIRYDWLLLGDNQKKVNQFLQLKCSLGPFIRGKIRRVLAKPRLILDEVCRLYGKFAS